MGAVETARLQSQLLHDRDCRRPAKVQPLIRYALQCDAAHGFEAWFSFVVRP
jgi:hypothetical protein